MLTPSLDRGGRRPTGVQAHGGLRRRTGGKRRRGGAQSGSSPGTNQAGGASCTGCRSGEHCTAPRRRLASPTAASRPSSCPGASWQRGRAERRARRSAARGAPRPIEWHSTQEHQQQVQQAPVEPRACAMPTRHTWPVEGQGCGERRRAHAQAHPLTLKRAVRQAPRVCALRGSSLSTGSHLESSRDDSRRCHVVHLRRTKPAKEKRRPDGESRTAEANQAADARPRRLLAHSTTAVTRRRVGWRGGGRRWSGRQRQARRCTGRSLMSRRGSGGRPQRKRGGDGGASPGTTRLTPRHAAPHSSTTPYHERRRRTSKGKQRVYTRRPPPTEARVCVVCVCVRRGAPATELP